MDASAGGADYDAAPASVGNHNAILGLRYQGRPWLYLALGAPLDSESPPWAAGGLGGRGESRVLPWLDLGADLASHAYGYHERTLDTTGVGLTLEALPFLALSHANARIELRSGLIHYTSAFGGVSSTRALHDSGARAWLRSSAGVRVGGEARYVRAEEGDYPYLGAAADLSLGRGSVWAYAGQWRAEALREPAWGIGGTIGVGGGFHVRASVEQIAMDPIYWNPSRRIWSVGVSRALGRAAEPAPAIPVVPMTSGGQVTLRLPLAEGGAAPAVAGDFTGWEPVAMRRSGSEWVVTLPVRPGVYHFAFRRADGTWFVPDSYPNRVDDGFGGVNAVLVVPAPDGG